MFEHHPLLQQHILTDELISLNYSDRYLFSPWSVMLIAELINGLKNQIKNTWKANCLINTSIKREPSYQKRGLLADWMDDDLRIKVISAYFEAAIDEHCIVQTPNDTPHGRVLELVWQSGKTTSIRLDQGVGYWQIDDKAPWFDDNVSKPEQQAEKMLSLISKLKVKNAKDFPTQVFVKER